MVEPRFRSEPEGTGELGEQAVKLAWDNGLKLDEWQQVPLRASLALRENGKWAAPDMGLNVGRQNGKGAVIIARILAELYLVRSPLTIYSAHNFDTALEHFRRLVWLIEGSSRLSAELLGRKGLKTYGVRWGKGNESIELRDGQRFHIRTRTASGGRGFSCDLLILDEAMILPEFMHSALEPIISARPNPQIWYTGSAVDQQTHEHGVVWSRIRERGIKGDPDLGYFEWSAGNGEPEKDNPDAVMPETLLDRAAWAQANPALGIRIDPEHVAREARGGIGRRGFAVERLGIGDWPRTDFVATNPLDFEAWMDLADPGGVIQDPLVLVYDVSPERKGAIAIAGTRKDGLFQVEVAESKGGTAWVAPEGARIAKEHRLKVYCDGKGPAASLAPEFRDLGVEVELITAPEHAQACGHLMDAVARGTFRHLDDPDLNSAVRAAVTRPLGDAWAWSRKDSATNIAPLVSATLALSAAMTSERPRKIAFAWA